MWEAGGAEIRSVHVYKELKRVSSATHVQTGGRWRVLFKGAAVGTTDAAHVCS